MPNSQNRLSQFWQELKRRKVIYVITVYASAAFVIIELVNNVVEPLNLPERTPTIIIVILAIGFPIAIILSWIFDLTPKGVEKTKPLGEEEESEMPVLQNRWKIATYISLIVIIGLIILNLVGGSTRLRAGDIQSLVILPFENYTGDDQLEYFVSGMHASLIQDMGRISGYRVVNRTSSNVYKNVDMRVHEIASELDADAAIEADVMCLGDSICLQIRVIRAFPEEETIWIADYKEDKSQILNLYNKITKQIADEIMIELTPEEERLLTKTRTVDRDAYDAFLRSHQLYGDYSEVSLKKAREYLNSAVEKDQDWAPLYVGLANVWIALHHTGHEPPEIARSKIYEFLNKALELDPDLADSYQLLGLISQMIEWDWDKAEREYLKAIASNPNDAMSRMRYAWLLHVLQRHNEALIQAYWAIDLDPMNPWIRSSFAGSLLNAGDCETALVHLEKVLTADPDYALAHNVIEKAAFQCGDYYKVFESAKYHIPIAKDSIKEIERIFADQGLFAAYEAILRQLEILMLNDNIMNPITIASKYNMVNQYDKAMDWIEKGYEQHSSAMPNIALRFYNFVELYENPRFIDIVEKMNLTLPTSN